MQADAAQGRVPLRLVTWNCAMALRRKWPQLRALAPDVAVIQECETPDKWPQGECTSALWHGGSRHKGLAIATFGDWRLEACEPIDPSIEYVLPARVVGAASFNILGVWAKASPIKERSYIGQVHRAAQVYASWMSDGAAAVVGDWNSNAQWDTERRANHTATVALLAKCGLTSAYHHHNRCPHGGEPRSTFHLYKRQDRGYHIDYCFIPEAWAANLRRVTVGDFAQWRAYSDHCPLVVDVEL